MQIKFGIAADALRLQLKTCWLCGEEVPDVGFVTVWTRSQPDGRVLWYDVPILWCPVCAGIFRREHRGRETEGRL